MAYFLNGQLAQTAGTVLVTASNVNVGYASMLTIRLYCPTTAATQNVAIKWVHAGVTTNLWTHPLFPGDAATIQNILIQPGDTITGSTTAGNTVDYSITDAAGGPFMAYVHDQYGAIKSTASTGGSGA